MALGGYRRTISQMTGYEFCAVTLVRFDDTIRSSMILSDSTLVRSSIQIFDATRFDAGPIFDAIRFDAIRSEPERHK